MHVTGGEDCGLFICAYAGFIEPLLLIEDFLLGGLQHGVEAPEDGHGENHVPVLATHVDVAEQVICDSPNEVGYLAKLGVLQRLFSWLIFATGRSPAGYAMECLFNDRGLSGLGGLRWLLGPL